VIRAPRYIKTICRTYEVGSTGVQEHACIYADKFLIKDQQNVLVVNYIRVFCYY